MIISGCLKKNPEERLTVEEIIDSEFLKDLRHPPENVNANEQILDSEFLQNWLHLSENVHSKTFP